MQELASIAGDVDYLADKKARSMQEGPKPQGLLEQQDFYAEMNRYYGVADLARTTADKIRYQVRFVKD